MRYAFDTNGNNITTNLQAQLVTTTVLPLADLFWLQYVNPVDANNGNNIKITNTFLTNAPYPVAVNKIQNQPGPNGIAVINATYLPARIQRGKMSYEIGFGDQTCDITWYVNDSIVFPAAVGHAAGTFGFKWAFLQGYLDECPMWVHRAYFNPLTPATPNSYPSLLGTTLMWRGFVRDVKIDRGQIVITLGSLMHFFQNVQVPTQTIQPGNRLPPFYPGSVINFGGSLTGAFVLSSCTPLDIQLTFSTMGLYPADHALRDSYFTVHQQPPPNGWTPHSGQPAPALFRIRDNVTNNTPVANTCHVYPYEPINPVTLLCVPNNTNQFLELFQPQPLHTGGANGFPYIPPPEVSF